MSRHLLLTACLLLLSLSLSAQRFSYVYIQGDKQTPFYVKLEGDMQPRYGKHYCILPQLAAGTIKLQILFQQNAYPAQQFTVQVPEAGNRAFMITQRNGVFSLYDLQQHFYLPAGNAASDDHLPAANMPPVTAEAPPADEPWPSLKPDRSEERAVKTSAKKKKAPKAEVSERIADEVPTEERPAAVQVVGDEPVAVRRTEKRQVKKQEPKVADNAEPAFLDVTLDGTRRQPQALNEAPAADTVFTQKKPLDATFRNSDCPEALPEPAFERIYKTMMEKSADEDRVSYLNGQLDKCYQTWQARTLGTMLSEDAARFTFLKNIYPHITDQQAFPLLDDMLRSEVWKNQFYQLTHR